MSQESYIPILIVSVQTDEATSKSHEAALQLVDWSQYEYTLLNTQANKENIEDVIDKYRPSAVIYYGHGEEDRLFGWDEKMVTFQNVSILKNTITVAIACLSGLGLGPAAILKGCDAYIGFLYYTFVAFREDEHDYHRDFADTFTIIPKYLLSGKNAQQAITQYKMRCDEYLDLYQENMDTWLNADYYFNTMKMNRDNLVTLGNPWATLQLRTDEYREEPINEPLKPLADYNKKIIIAGITGTGIVTALTAYLLKRKEDKKDKKK